MSIVVFLLELYTVKEKVQIAQDEIEVPPVREALTILNQSKVASMEVPNAITVVECH